MQSRERHVIQLLRRTGLVPLSEQKILEIGCNFGYWLSEFIKWGALPENLLGIELVFTRVAKARALQASRLGLAQANAAYLPLASSTFDLVLQSLVFSSILDPAMKQAVAGEMLRVLKPRGFLLWYDFHVNNPWNRDVQGVKKKEIYRLFPGCRGKLQRVILAPPLTRLLAPYSPLLCSFLEKLRLFNTFYLGILQKPA